MWAPGIVGLVVGLGLLIAVKDSPEKIGYPPVEIVKPKVLCFGSSCGACAHGFQLTFLEILDRVC